MNGMRLRKSHPLIEANFIFDFAEKFTMDQV